jgi:hypothetical protein
VSINGVEDIAGNVVTPVVSSFTTGSEPDTTAPTVVMTSPVYSETDVPLNAVIKWAFSEPIDPASLLGYTSALYDYSSGYVQGGTLSLGVDGRTVTYVPPGPLVAGHQYLASLPSVYDLSGNLGNSGSSVFFTAGTAADATAAQVVAVTPSNGVSGVPRNARVRIAFDEPIALTSTQNVRVLVSGTPITVASRTLSDGNRVLTLTLAGLLAANTTHTISIVGVENRAGQVTSTVTTTFTTGTSTDLVSPTAPVTTVPANGATGIAVSVAPTVTFSEPIDPTSVLYGGVSGVVLQVAATSQIVPVVYSFSADSQTVTLTPVSPLAAGTQYRIRVSSVVKDLAGNAFATTVQNLFTTQP